MGRAKRIWYLSPMRAAKVQASLRIRTVSPEPPLLAHRSSESIGTFRLKARSLALLNGWACAVKICHDGMPEDTDSLDAAQMIFLCGPFLQWQWWWASTWDYGTYHTGDQRRLRRACASSQSRQSLRCSHTWNIWQKGPTKNQTSTCSPTGWLGMHVWRMSLRRTKSTIISWDGSNGLEITYLEISCSSSISWLENRVDFVWSTLFTMNMYTMFLLWNF